jgi:hypothetical protein
MVEPMGINPFLKSPFSRQSGTNRRRSTRVEFAIPVVLSGRDAKGQPFREESQTKTVNLHGAKLKTSREILVGMQVCIENPQNAATEKGVCVRIEEKVPGEDAHYIAVQLIRPGNIWGLVNPPADWAVVAANMLGSNTPPSQGTVMVQSAVPTADCTSPIIESQVVTWEQQSADLVDSVLQILRQQIQALSSAALHEFEDRLQLLEKEAGDRLEHRAGKTVAEVSTLIHSMREDIASQITAHGKQVVNDVEHDLRAKVAEILAPRVGVSSDVLARRPVGIFPRK